MEREKYHEFDKVMSNKIMSEFRGKKTVVVCPDCIGKGCDECSNMGSVTYEW